MEEKEMKCNCKDNCTCDEHECNCSEGCTCNENNPIVIENCVILSPNKYEVILLIINSYIIEQIEIIRVVTNNNLPSKTFLVCKSLSIL